MQNEIDLSMDGLVAKGRNDTFTGLQTLFPQIIMQDAFALFAGSLVPSCRKLALVLGNGCERLCASRPLLGPYVHQESI